jgi:pimeloyl-ACP methyl ester carboxylesterase
MLEGAVMEKILFRTFGGLKLCGYLDEPEGLKGRTIHSMRGGKAKRSLANRAVIMLHGFTGDKSESGFFDKIAAEIAKAGLAVLRFDFSGCGESDDAAISVKGQVEDALAAIEFMKARGYDNLGLLGFSLGGLVALRARDPSVKARVLLAPLTKSKNIPSGYSFWDKFVLIVTGERKLVKQGRKWRQEMVIGRSFYFEVRSISQHKIAEGIKEPVLIIHGDKDSRVPLEYSRDMMKLLPKSASLEVVKGVDHHFDDNKLGVPRVARLSAEWFVKNLR